MQQNIDFTQNINLNLMMKDQPVMRINFGTLTYEVLKEALLPYPLKGRLKHYSYSDAVDDRQNLLQMQIAVSACRDAVISFLAARVLPLDRENAKKVLNLLRLEQTQSPEYRAKIALFCRAVSLQDNYWFKEEKEDILWKDVDIRQNKLSDVVAQVALHGSSLTLQGKVQTPELTTHGAYAKCWKRDHDELFLYKKGFQGEKESRIEVEVSNILDKCNVSHVRYEATSDMGKYCCKCKCMTTGQKSILSGLDFIAYCNANGLCADTEMFRIDPENMYKMYIVDYLISNRDRHGGNWGFFYDCDTMKILGCHPLFDHNNAFDSAYMKDPNGGMNLFTNKPMLATARMAMKHVDFHFTAAVKRSDFYYRAHYDSFMERAETLGLIQKKKRFWHLF